MYINFKNVYILRKSDSVSILLKEIFDIGNKTLKGYLPSN